MITSILIAFSIAAAPAAQSGTVAMDRPVVAQAAGAGSAAPGTNGSPGSGSTNMGGSGTTPQPAPTTPQPAPGAGSSDTGPSGTGTSTGRTRLALVAPPRIPAQREPVEPAAPWGAPAARPARCKTRRARNNPNLNESHNEGRPEFGRPFVLALRATYRVRAGFGAVTRRLGRAHEGPSSRHQRLAR